MHVLMTEVGKRVRGTHTHTHTHTPTHAHTLRPTISGCIALDLQWSKWFKNGRPSTASVMLYNRGIYLTIFRKLFYFVVSGRPSAPGQHDC